MNVSTPKAALQSSTQTPADAHLLSTSASHTTPLPHADLVAVLSLLALLGLSALGPTIGSQLARLAIRRPSAGRASLSNRSTDKRASEPAQAAAPDPQEKTASTPAAGKAEQPPLTDPLRRDLGKRLQHIRQFDSQGLHQHRCLIAEAHLNFGRLRTADELISRIEYEITRAKASPLDAHSLKRNLRSAVLLSRDERVEDIAAASLSTATDTPARPQARPHDQQGPGDAVIDWEP